MAKRIALFNHKGGVSKTTTTFNLGWMLASKGHRVVLVDTDPQCNLTGLVLGYKSSDEFENFYTQHPNRNIRSGLASAFESRPVPIQAIECVEVVDQPNLLLLPGHIRLAEYEVTLGIAQELSGSIQTLQNLPGSIAYLLEETAKHYDAEYILIDMSPSLSSINQNLLMTSHYFLVPCSPDFFSVMAIDSLASILPKWAVWAEKAAKLQILQQATYPFPAITPKFLGTIVQRYRPRGGEPSTQFQTWIEQIGKTVSSSLFPELQKNNLTLPIEKYRDLGIGEDYCVSTIADFNSLIATSQREQTPVFALTEEQIKLQGVVLDSAMSNVQTFKEIFGQLADKIISLTS